jgi:four helix bundle protein
MTGSDKFGFRFRDWDIYKDARLLRKEIKMLTKNFPVEERFALTDQTHRALNSIILNIAEASSKNTDKDTRLYINRAQCSLDEVVGCLDCAYDDGYVNSAQHEEVLEKASSLAKRLRGFSNHLKDT